MIENSMCLDKSKLILYLIYRKVNTSFAELAKAIYFNIKNR